VLRGHRLGIVAALCSLGLMGAAMTAAPILGAATAKVHTVKLAGFAFSPKTVNAHVGDTVNFVWVNGVHNVVSRSGPQKVNSGAPVGGRKPFVVKLTKKGTYKIVCVPHESLGMKMTIRVT
jgi:plastocyanin